MRTTCKNADCGKTFSPERAGAQYCSSRCRTAAHRVRHKPLPPTRWFGKVPSMRSEKETLAEHLLELASGEDGGEPKTGRRYYYLALSYGYIAPDMGASDAAKASREAAYDKVTEVLGTLRKARKLSWDMVLDLTRELDVPLFYADPREARAQIRNIYDEDRWLGQDYYPILIVEKDTMEPVCKPMADGWQMPFASSRGYGPLRLQYDVAELLNRRYAKTKQRGLVLFISDLDPSGEDLQRAWEEALSDFLVRADVVRIGLTIEQVRDNRDPRGNPLADLAIDVKGTDSRAKGYGERYQDEPLVQVQVTVGKNKKGEDIDVYAGRCWEADVLPANVIAAAIDAQVRGWLNAKLWKRRAAEIERARKLL